MFMKNGKIFKDLFWENVANKIWNLAAFLFHTYSNTNFYHGYTEQNNLKSNFTFNKKRIRNYYLQF